MERFLLRYLNSKKTFEKEPLVRTSQIIWEHDRLKKIEGKHRVKIIFGISCLLAVSTVIAICMLYYDAYDAKINQRFDYFNNTNSFCDASQFSEIDLISTPIAACLIILYIIIYKRRVFLRNDFKYRNIGLPMVVSCWNKVNKSIYDDYFARKISGQQFIFEFLKFDFRKF